MRRLLCERATASYQGHRAASGRVLNGVTRGRRRDPQRSPRGGVATHRKRAILAGSSDALRRSTIAGPIRSSSCAQTDAEHETVSTPARSAVGVASAAIASPTTSRQTRCTSASSVSGASSSWSRSSASAQRSRAAPATRHPLSASSSTRPSRHPIRATPASAAPGTCSRSVVVITDWPPARAADRRARGAARDRARSSRRRAASAAALRGAPAIASRSASSSARSAESLLALRAVCAQLAAPAEVTSSSRCGP